MPPGALPALPLVEDPNVLWVGTFDEAVWTQSFGMTGEGQPSRTSLEPAPRGGHGRALRIVNDGGGTSGDRWGYDARLGFSEAGVAPQEEAYFRYYVWFPDDYEFDTQGKMPGLQGVVPGGSPWLPANSISCPPGHRYAGQDCRDPRAFSARTMWKNGGMITYLGAETIDGRHADTVRVPSGDNYSFAFAYEDADGERLELEPGWNYVEQRVKLNTPGREDGIFEGWINGVQGVRLTKVQWRTQEFREVQISQWNLVHFWGGPPEDYPQRATSVYYDDFVLSRAPIGPRR